MHFALLREHVRSELGGDPTEIFDDFETTAFASASLGQVHRARLKGSGKRVAVKIQYPDIDRTIRSDMKNLKAAGFGMRFSGDWKNLLEQYESIERMLEREVDYVAEARHMEAARKCLQDLDDVVVPAVIHEFSTKRVLTMDYIEGQHLEPFMAREPSQEVRDTHGAQIVRALSRLWYTGRVVYADPHPGNFLFLPDGRLGLIDFGCSHSFSDEDYEDVMGVERASTGTEAEWRQAMAEGCDLEPDQMGEERYELMRKDCNWLWEPIRAEGAFDFGRPGQFEEGVRLYGTFIKRRWTRSRPINCLAHQTLLRRARNVDSPGSPGRIRSHHARGKLALGLTGTSAQRAARFHAGTSRKPSSIQPLTPPTISFTGRPRRARAMAPRTEPLQCGPAQYTTNRVSNGNPDRRSSVKPTQGI